MIINKVTKRTDNTKDLTVTVGDECSYITDANGQLHGPGDSFCTPKNSYIYLWSSDRRECVWNESVWMPTFMSNQAFRFKVTENCTVTDKLMDWSYPPTNSSGLVFDDIVDQDYLAQCGITVLHSQCTNRIRYMYDPEPCSRLTDESITLLKQSKTGKDVSIVVASGCGSAQTIEENMMDLLPAIYQGVKSYGLDGGTPIFVYNSRMEIGDFISECVGSTVTCVLIPDWTPMYAPNGTISAIITYKATTDMRNPSQRRTYLTNPDMAPGAEIGAHVADLIWNCLNKKASGQELYNIMTQ